MKQIFTILGLCITIMLGDNYFLLPFDWSGQYGMMAVKGRLFWNQDWLSGPLFFDGTYAYYPLRFGPQYLESFTSNEPGVLLQPKPIPDSSIVVSSFDYRRGDYLYDLLELNADFGDGSRLIHFNGFKRTYAGAYGQYIQPTGLITPIQQSYRLDYFSNWNEDQVAVSVAHLVTNSGLPDSLSKPNGFHTDRITVGGIDYIHPFGSWTWRLHVSQYDQKYNVDLSSLIDFPPYYLHRGHLQIRLLHDTEETSPKYLALIIDWQSLKKRSDWLKKRQWSTLYGGIAGQKMNVNLGFTFSNTNAVEPYLRLEYNPVNGKVEFNSSLQVEAHPNHIVQWSDSSRYFFEKRYTASAALSRSWERLSIGVNLDGLFVKDFQESFRYYSPQNYPDITSGLFSGGLSGQWEVIRRWKIALDFQHTISTSSLSNGIWDRLHIELTGAEALFNKHMNTIFRLWLDGLLKRDNMFGFDPFTGVPFLTDDSQKALPEYWVANLEISAVVSTVTLTWSVHNLLNAFESPVKQVFPGIRDDDLWIRNNYHFPPMGQLIRFEVLWNLEN